jgi:hypothetical protein
MNYAHWNIEEKKDSVFNHCISDQRGNGVVRKGGELNQGSLLIKERVVYVLKYLLNCGLIVNVKSIFPPPFSSFE